MRNYFLIFLLVVVLFGFSGCVSTSNVNKKIGEIENRVQLIEEQQVQLADGLSEQRIAQRDLQNLVESLKEKEATKAAVVSITPTTKQIQSALKTAGYYAGNIDGVAGDNTKDAINKFQKENGLVADGVVGRNTWSALSKYYNGDES